MFVTAVQLIQTHGARKSAATVFCGCLLTHQACIYKLGPLSAVLPWGTGCQCASQW